MAKIVCSKSSVEFHCEHMPLSLSSRETHHPLFSTPKKKLISLAAQWASGRLSPTESYLLYLSLLDSTDLIIWRVPATYNSKTSSIVANNMESLIHIIGKIDLIKHPSFCLPKFAISHDTANLENSYHWIEAWRMNYIDWYDGLRESSRQESLKTALDNRETSLQRLIKSAETRIDDLAALLAGWAEVAGDFPQSTSTIPHPFLKSRITIAEYWKQIIRACTNDDAIWRYPATDIDELIDHCENNIIHGSIYSHKLMQLLRQGYQKNRDYLGMGDVDLAGKTATQFTLLAPASSAEDANKLAAIQAAPLVEPKEFNYPNRFAFLKAKANYDMCKRYRDNGDKL